MSSERIIAALVTQAERVIIEEAANAVGETLSEFVRKAALERVDTLQ